MTIYRCVIPKKPRSVMNGDISAIENDLNDFETNYKDLCVRISDVAIEGFTPVDWTTFKSKVDGTTITWDMVSYIETSMMYVLILSV